MPWKHALPLLNAVRLLSCKVEVNDIGTMLPVKRMALTDIYMTLGYLVIRSTEIGRGMYFVVSTSM